MDNDSKSAEILIMSKHKVRESASGFVKKFRVLVHHIVEDLDNKKKMTDCKICIKHKEPNRWKTS